MMPNIYLHMLWPSTYSIATFIAELVLAKSSGNIEDPLSVTVIVIKSVTS